MSALTFKSKLPILLSTFSITIVTSIIWSPIVSLTLEIYKSTVVKSSEIEALIESNWSPKAARLPKTSAMVSPVTTKAVSEETV